MAITNATNQQLIDLTHALADALTNRTREQFDALPNNRRRQLATVAFGYLAEGGRRVVWPADKPDIVIAFEAVDLDDNHFRIERYIEPGDTVPRLPRDGDVFDQTYEVVLSPLTNPSNKFRARQSEIQTVLAGSSDAVETVLQGKDGQPITVTQPLNRERAPENATGVGGGPIVWTEGPISVARYFFAGRDPLDDVVWP